MGQAASVPLIAEGLAVSEGVVVAAETTAVTTTAVGLSTAATACICVAGVAIVVIGIGGLIYYFRNRSTSTSNTIERTQSQQPLNIQQLDINYSGYDIPKWEKIQMSQQEFNDLEMLTEKEYVKMVKKSICPYTKQIMRKPCQMTCCKNKTQKKDRWAEQALLQFQIDKNKRCLLCQSPATRESIKIDKMKQAFIYGFRQMVYKTYKYLPPSQHQKWKKLIDDQFGVGYTNQHIVNHNIIA